MEDGGLVVTFAPEKNKQSHQANSTCSDGDSSSLSV